MQNRWRIADKLQLLKRNAEGNIVPCLPMVFHDGDFVEATAYVDIVTKGKGFSGNRDVHFVLQKLVQLKASKDIAVSRL